MKPVKLFGNVFLVQSRSSDELFDLVLCKENRELPLVEEIPDPCSYHETDSHVLDDKYLDLVEHCLDVCTYQQTIALLEEIKSEQVDPTKIAAFLTNQMLAWFES
jgi:hypothetical protein